MTVRKCTGTWNAAQESFVEELDVEEKEHWKAEFEREPSDICK